jgi:hypothetical protein
MTVSSIDGNNSSVVDGGDKGRALFRALEWGLLEQGVEGWTARIDIRDVEGEELRLARIGIGAQDIGKRVIVLRG